MQHKGRPGRRSRKFLGGVGERGTGLQELGLAGGQEAGRRDVRPDALFDGSGWQARGTRSARALGTGGGTALVLLLVLPLGLMVENHRIPKGPCWKPTLR